MLRRAHGLFGLFRPKYLREIRGQLFPSLDFCPTAWYNLFVGRKMFGLSGILYDSTRKIAIEALDEEREKGAFYGKFSHLEKTHISEASR